MVMTKYKVTITNRDNVEYEVDAKRPILDELRNQGVDLPYGCKYGGCITCAAKLTFFSLLLAALVVLLSSTPDLSAPDLSPHVVVHRTHQLRPVVQDQPPTVSEFRERLAGGEELVARAPPVL